MWKSQRNFSLRTLRNLGLGKSKFEGRIHEEVQYMINLMNQEIQTHTTGIQIKRLLGPSVSNIIMLMTMGKRYDFDHEVRQTLDRLILKDNSKDYSNSIINFYVASHFTSTFKFIIESLPTFLVSEMREFMNYLPNMITKFTHERKVIVDQMSDYELGEESDHFIDAYLKHLKMLETSTHEDHVGERQFFTGETSFF